MEDAPVCPSLRKVAVHVAYPVAVVTRPAGNALEDSSYQTLIFSNDRDALFGSDSGARSCIFELRNGSGKPDKSFCLGVNAIDLQELGPDGNLRPYCFQVALHRAVYDNFSKAVYFVEGRALMRLSPDNVVSHLAGHREACGFTDGPGPSARFQLPSSLVSDGAGSLYVADCCTVRRVALPGPNQLPGTDATVSTVYACPGSAPFIDVAYDNNLGRLYAATRSAVFRLDPDRKQEPVRLAGCEGNGGTTGMSLGPGNNHGHAAGTTSGWPPSGASSYTLQSDGAAAGGSAATAAATAIVSPSGAPYSGVGCSTSERRFLGISGLVWDGEGGLLIADRQQVYRLGADGGSGSVICLGKSDTSWGAAGCYPVMLPHGWLALSQYHDRRVLLLHLGLRPAVPEACGEGVAGLLSDLGSLLGCGVDGCPDDAEVEVGGRVFRCHRLILAARCLYFRRLFAGGFADSGTRRVVLQDADPDAFSHLLRYLYTGDLAFPGHRLRAIAELADRLLLNQVVHHIHRCLLAAAQPAQVVSDMLWAHQQGFEDLLAGLKEWYLKHQSAVLAADPDQVRQMFEAAPALMYDLHCATVRQLGGRNRLR